MIGLVGRIDYLLALSEKYPPETLLSTVIRLELQEVRYDHTQDQTAPETIPEAAEPNT